MLSENAKMVMQGVAGLMKELDNLGVTKPPRDKDPEASADEDRKFCPYCGHQL